MGEGEIFVVCREEFIELEVWVGVGGGGTKSVSTFVSKG